MRRARSTEWMIVLSEVVYWYKHSLIKVFFPLIITPMPIICHLAPEVKKPKSITRYIRTTRDIIGVSYFVPPTR
jgi:hypothetical protein